jgi:hypothetical protein
VRGTADAERDSPPVIAATLPIWIPDWAHDCCGTRVWLNVPRRFALTLEGNERIEPDDGPDSVLVREDGSVVLVGSVVPPESLRHGEAGTVVRSGGVRFGVMRECPAVRVRCTGELTEVRHADPYGYTRAVVRRIGLIPMYYAMRSDAAGLEFAGFGPEERLYGLEHDRPQHLDELTSRWARVTWKFKLLVDTADEAEAGDNDPAEAGAT